MHNDLCMPDEPLIGSAEACEAIGIDRSTLTRWVAQGRITPAHKMPGSSGAFLFKRADVAQLVLLRAEPEYGTPSLFGLEAS
jgi:excisionase family DNA binding protein